MKNKAINKIAALLLSLILVVGTTPITAFAAENDSTLPLGESTTLGESSEDITLGESITLDEIATLGESITPNALEGYHPDDVEAINNIIKNNGLAATRDDPDSWGFVTWDASTPMRIETLDLWRKNLTGGLSLTGLAALESLDCNGNQLSSLSLSDLPALEFLYCYDNRLSSLSLTDLPALTTLWCSYNRLSSLSLSDLPALYYLDCQSNQLSSLSLTDLPALTQLDCSINQLISLSLTDLPALTTLDYSINQLISLSLTDLTTLDYLNCSSNQLSSLSLTDLPALTKLDCRDNQLISLNLTDLPALTTLNCSLNQLSSLSLTDLPALTTLWCYNNQLSSLSLTDLPALTELNCDSNQLSSLDLAGLTALKFLNCDNNQLSSLSLTDLPALTKLDCSFNQLSSLSLTDLPAFTRLDCYNNQLSSLSLTDLPALTMLICSDNQLINLGLTGLSALNYLECYNNQLSSLDLSGLTALNYLDCRYNCMTLETDITGQTPTTTQFYPQQIRGNIGVSSIGNLPTIATATLDLTLSGMVFPSTATKQTIVWSMNGAGTTGATISGNVLSTTGGGFVFIIATITDGITSGRDYTQQFIVNVLPYSDLTVNGGRGGGSHAASQVVTITADPDPAGQVFYKWQITPPASFVSGYNNTMATSQIYMPSVNTTATAIYGYITTLQTDGNGRASVDKAIALAGEVITLTATPNSGYRFKEWRVVAGGVTITNNQFTMPASGVTVKAVFEAVPYAVTIQPSANGSAVASKDPATIGETITLTATPDSGYRFKEWQVVAGSVTITNNQFTMPASAVTVKAVFELIPTYAVTLQTDGNGSASADKTIAPAGEVITLTATPSSGYRFKEWQVVAGGVTITNDQFTMPASGVTVKAVFESTVTVQTDGNGSASADKNWAASGEIITLTATPASGYRFKEWQVVAGGVTITNNQFTMPAGAVTVKAVFELIPPVTTTYSPRTSSDGKSTVDTSLVQFGRPFTKPEAIKLFNAALAAKPEGQTTLSFRANNYTKVDKTVLTVLATLAKKSGVTLTVHFDTVVGKAVTYRISVNPAVVTTSLDVTAKLANGKMTLPKLSVAIEIAVKMPVGVTMKNLKITQNGKDITASAKPWLDKNGYLHFTTTGGEIVLGK